MAGPQRRLGENGIIEKYLVPLSHPEMSFGFSDDAAFMRQEADQHLVMTKDMLVADIHFFASDQPDLIARKALRVNLSDLAAKGAEPVGYLLGLGLPETWSESWLAAFCAGLEADQKVFGFPLIGGDTVKSPDRLTLSVTALGKVPRDKVLLRKNAKAGDDVYVTGSIGDAALGLDIIKNEEKYEFLSEQDRAFLKDRFWLPQPRTGMRPFLRQFATASMDLSDGLIGDAGKMAKAAGVLIELDETAIPYSLAASKTIGALSGSRMLALGGGDDYELLFCASALMREQIDEAIEQENGLPITRIGRVREGHGLKIRDRENAEIDLCQTQGYEHF
ncbi:thiamine-phosphate kinase [uncultured Cohaesibacter sp.]|uniref:thiamine-phosphate kinase n=1 Tax=uncultured Cohaesibacter sp. TaxID=1002546 RepID=UPI002931E70B|nr:thiamine-phosphate kinase [uncultured Cohaesibacter sp.]